MPITKEYNSEMKMRLGTIDEWIKKKKYLISGSFIISVIRNINYESSDIDIYVNYPFKMSSSERVESEFEDFIVSELGGVLKVESYTGLDARSHKYIIKNGLDINIINLPNKSKNSMKRYIKTISDLDICSGIYDGYWIDFPLAIITGNATEINQQASFRTSAEYERYSFKRKLRLYKYLIRGFIIKTSLIFNDDNFEYNRYVYEMRQKNINDLILSTLDFICDKMVNPDNKQKLINLTIPLTEFIITNVSECLFVNAENDEILIVPDWVTKWNERKTLFDEYNRSQRQINIPFSVEKNNMDIFATR